MASAWGNAWGVAWGDAWGAIAVAGQGAAGGSARPRRRGGVSARPDDVRHHVFASRWDEPQPEPKPEPGPRQVRKARPIAPVPVAGLDDTATRLQREAIARIDASNEAFAASVAALKAYADRKVEADRRAEERQAAYRQAVEQIMAARAAYLQMIDDEAIALLLLAA